MKKKRYIRRVRKVIATGDASEESKAVMVIELKRGKLHLTTFDASGRSKSKVVEKKDDGDVLGALWSHHVDREEVVKIKTKEGVARTRQRVVSAYTTIAAMGSVRNWIHKMDTQALRELYHLWFDRRGSAELGLVLREYLKFRLHHSPSKYDASAPCPCCPRSTTTSRGSRSDPLPISNASSESSTGAKETRHIRRVKKTASSSEN